MPRLSPALWIFALALVLRVGWVTASWVRSGPALSYPDEEFHWQLATNLVRHGAMVSDDGRYVARMPLYPLLLAPFAALGLHGILLARLAQAAMGAAAAWVVYRFTRRGFGERVGMIAGVLMAIDPFMIFFSNLLLTETPYVLISVGCLAAAWRLLADPGPKWERNNPDPSAKDQSGAGDKSGLAALGLTAVLGAAAILTRPSAFGWIVLTWGLLWLLHRDKLRGTLRVGICAGVLALALLPWGLRNRAVTGHFAWLSANGGVTLYDAQGPQARGDSDQQFLEQMPELAYLGEVERDRALYRLALEQMRSDPARVLELAGIKFLRTWSPTPNVAEYRRGPAAIAGAVFTIAVLVLAAVGLWRTARTHWRLHLLLWLPVAYFTLLHCVFVGSLRYRVPLMPMVEIAAAAAFIRPRNSAEAGPRLSTRRTVDAAPSSPESGATLYANL